MIKFTILSTGYAQQGSIPTDASRDLQKLAGSVRQIQMNLEGISQMSLSPRREKKTENLFEDSDKTPKNRSISLSGVDVTPPVRDSGPGTVVKVVSGQQQQHHQQHHQQQHQQHHQQQQQTQETATRSKFDQVLSFCGLNT